MSTWDCDKCTFINSTNDLTCIMCYQVRASTRDQPYVWQWQPSEWVPYDGPSNEQLEAAYQAGAPKCDLTAGWFATRQGEYTVLFNRRPMKGAAGGPSALRSAIASMRAAMQREPTAEEDEDDGAEEGEAPSAMAAKSDASDARAGMIPAFVQRNNQSGMTRKVRRLANDDDSMFVVLPPSQTARDAKCGICAEEWWEEGENETDAAANGTTAATAAATAPAAAAAAPLSAASDSSSNCLAQHPDDTWPSSEQANVKLPKCMPGHSYHRSCISSWIKLKDQCPTCGFKI